MYSKIGKISIEENFDFSNDELIVVSKENDRRFISFLELNGKLKKSLEDYPAYDFIIASDKLIFTSTNGDFTYCFFKDNKRVKILPYVLHLKGHQLNNKCLCYAEVNKEETFIIISVESLEILMDLGKEIGFGNVDMWFEDILISRKSSKGIVGGFKLSGECLWELDFSEQCGFDTEDGFERVEIKNIYYEGDYLYVLAGLSIVKIKITTGEIIWLTDLKTWQSRGVIAGNFIYTTSNGTFNKLSLETGEILYKKNIDIVKKNNKSLFGPIKELVSYENSIYTLLDSNPNALIEFNIEDGSYKNIFMLDALGIKSNALILKFYRDKMYISDINNNLHIFQKEETIS